MIKKQFLAMVVLFSITLVTSVNTVWAKADQSCFSNYYNTKDKECLSELVQLFQADHSQQGNQKIGDTFKIQPLIGMMAEIFRSDSEKKAEILHMDATPYTKGAYIESLYRAGLADEAQSFASSNGLAKLAEFYAEQNLQPITDLMPKVLPGDNDLLIGAYGISGDSRYIRQILANFETAGDERARDAFRMGLMNSKFGGGMAYKGRDNTMVKTACKKYHCETDIKDFMRTMTLASAIWALSSSSDKDEGIKKALTDFFDSVPKLKTAYLVERNEFSNYLTLLSLNAAVPDDARVNEALTSYEELKMIDTTALLKDKSTKLSK